MTENPNTSWLPVLAALVRARYGEGEALAPTRLSGGASRTTWLLPARGRRPVLFLQQERPGGVPGQSGQRAEVAAIRAARSAGVPAPVVVSSSTDPAAPGELGDYLLVEGLPGDSDPVRLQQAPELATARERFANDIGACLARLHMIPAADLGELPVTDPLTFYRSLLDQLGEPHPALELALAWLDGNRPPAPQEPVLVHGDFRVGNLMFDDGGLSGVLDWEIAHVGDPAEDLGWLCVSSWRFGGAGRAGGVADVHDVIAGYRAAGGRRAVTAQAVHWWEVFGTFKWAVICVMQAAAHLSGAERSVELAVLGRRTASIEQDVLDLIGAPRATGFTGPADTASPADPHDSPGAADLIEAVRELLAGQILTELDGRTAFLARVAARALSISERELRRAVPLQQRHAERLTRLGVTGDRALVQAIRDGAVDYDTALVEVAEAVADKLLVSDPRRLPPG